MKKRNFLSKAAVVIGVISVVGVGTLRSRASVYAAANDVVINEIMYNPASGVDNDEYIELYNTTGSPIDLEGWCFTNGITFCFNAGTSLAAHSYGVVSRDAAQTLSTYGVSTIGTYTGKLDNGGERVTLTNSASQVVADLTYDDAPPWPTTPDGNGPSLELKDPGLDTSLASSWGASLANGGTPGVANSVYTANTPDLTEFSVPNNPLASSTPLVTVHASNADTVNLKYVVMFDSEQTIAMVDDGTNGDQTAGDGVYSAQVPAQAAGSLVRVKVEASNSDGTSQLPDSGDSMPHKSYIVSDGQTSELPIVRWYIDPDIYDDLVNNHASDDYYVSAIIAVGDQIFDNAEVKVKGQSSISYPKKKFNFKLPDGYTLGQPYFQHPVDEFSINTYFLNMTDIQERLAWEVFSAYGFDDLQGQYVRVQKNNDTDTSQFFGHYLLIESYDKTWRERTNHQNGALYKQFSDKKTRTSEDHSDITAFRDNLQNLHGDALKEYLLDNVDIPALINYDAISKVILSDDWAFYKNIYQYRDTEGTQRWSLLPWDLDNALAMPIFKEGQGPMSMDIDPRQSANPSYDVNRLTQIAMYQFPEFREMYLRRFASLYDALIKHPQIKTWYQELYAKSHNTIDQDLVKWQPEKAALLDALFPDGFPWEFADGFPYAVTPEEAMSGEATAETQNNMFLWGLGRYEGLRDTARANGEFPQPQSSQAQVVVNEIHYEPTEGSDAEYLELFNPGDTAVDVSGWRLSGTIETTLPQGSVIPAGSYAVIVKDDVQFRSTYSGSQLVLGEYQHKLGNDAQNNIQLRRADGSLVTSFAYGISSPWPSTPNGFGFSLSLIRADGDPTSPYCWAPSQSPGGTPGAPNSLDQSWAASYSSQCQPLKSSRLASTGASSQLSLIFGSCTILLGLILQRLRNYSKLVMLKYRISN